MTGSFTMYTTPWCGYCFRLEAQLERSGIDDFDIVDIEQHPEAADIVQRVNRVRAPCRPWCSATGPR